jgi:2-(1,2-epoxy-1,2-dihydrophenyl)acetyl-CoA isomerase
MTHMPNGTVRFEVGDGIATATLDRPDSLNAMTDDLMDDVVSAVVAAEADLSVGVLILTGSGRAFCAGADLKEADIPGPDDGGSGGGDLPSMDAHFHPAIRALYECRVPTVSRINGVTAGGGLGLALACDISIAARSAFFVATFGPLLGIVPDLGTTWQLSTRLGRARALGLAMLGDRLSAADAADWGLIYAVVDDDALDAETARVANVLKRSSSEAMTRIRSAIDVAPHHGLSEQLEVEGEHQRILIPMNMKEAAAAFLEKRPPEFGRRSS